MIRNIDSWILTLYTTRNVNKATYSSELCEKLLSIYAKERMTVYDPFIGTGTTAVAAKKLGMKYIGSEISPKQCSYAESRICEIPHMV